MRWFYNIMYVMITLKNQKGEWYIFNRNRLRKICLSRFCSRIQICFLFKISHLLQNKKDLNRFEYIIQNDWGLLLKIGSRFFLPAPKILLNCIFAWAQITIFPFSAFDIFWNRQNHIAPKTVKSPIKSGFSRR